MWRVIFISNFNIPFGLFGPNFGSRNIVLPLDRDLLWCLLRLLGFLLLISTNWRSKKGVVHRKVSFGLTTHSACLWAISGAKADHPWHFIVFFTKLNTKPSLSLHKNFLELNSIQTYIIFPVKFWICCCFERNSLTELRTFQNQPMKLREIVNNNKTRAKTHKSPIFCKILTFKCLEVHVYPALLQDLWLYKPPT